MSSPRFLFSFFKIFIVIEGIYYISYICVILFDASNFFSRPLKNTLFYVDFVLDDNGPHYSTNLATFETSVIALFDKGISSTQAVPQLEKVCYI